MLTTRCVLRFVLLGLCLPFGAFGETKPGTLEGDFSVGDQGEGTYTIPIAAPEGAGGLTANLALRYNHLSGNGLAGMRWTLTGLSAITRCPRTYAQDGAPVAVVNGTTDRFCLDGARLVNLTGAYGAANTEYRTEIETFRRVMQLGTQAGGPLSFRVDHPNGLSSYYGVTEDSKVGAPGSVVKRWLISYTEDQFGNRITYTYNENATTDETVPVEVAWTQNAALSMPPYKVSIVYETRPPDDQRFPWDAGGFQWQSTQRIDKIEVKYNGALINRYELTYGTSPASGTGRSQLASVQVCGPTDCLPATNFTVQNGLAQWAALVNSTQPAGSSPLIGDVSGDGRDDVFAVLGGTWHLYLGNNGAFGLDAAVNTGFSAATAPEKARVFDYNADGKSDLLYQTGGTWHVLRMTQQSPTPAFTDVNTALSTSTYPSVEIRDFDGDGLTDLLYQSAAGLSWIRNTGGSLAAPVIVGSDLNFFGVGAQYAAPDVNGDGRPDVFIIQDASCENGPDGDVCTGELAIYVAAGSTYVYARSFGFGTFSNPRAINLNGDGLADVMYVAGSTWHTRINLGTAFTAAHNTGIPATNAAKVFVADYDSDGRHDLIRPDGDYFHVHRSTSVLPASPTISVYSPGAGTTGGVATDISGDGFTDIVRVSGGNWHFHKHSTPLPDVATAFVNGLGYSVNAVYSPLPNTNNYSLNRGPLSTPYNQWFIGPRYVVTTETRDSSVAAPHSPSQTFVHYYADAIVDVAGRGWLTFINRQVEEPSGIRHTAELWGTFPRAGQAHYRSVILPNAPHGGYRRWDMMATIGLTTWTTTTPNRHFVRTEQFNTATRDLVTNEILTSTNEDPTYDETYGIVTTLDKRVSQSAPPRTWRSVTTINATNFVTSTEWCLGMPASVVTVNTLPDFTTSTRTIANTFNASDCTIATTTDESEANLAKRHRTSFGYNAYGNVTSIAEDSADGTAQDRSTAITYDAGQQLPASMTVNGVNLTTQFTWNYLFGARATVTTPDLLTTSFAYDDFGRVKQTTVPQASTTFSYGDCPCWPQSSRFFLRTQGSDGSVRHQFFDEQQRTVGTSWTLPRGTEGRQETRYNALGQTEQVSKPYVSVDPVYWTTYNYEPFTGRLLQENAPIDEDSPSGAVTSYQYPGLDVWVTNRGNHTTKYVHNGLGQIEQVIDALNGATSYTYKHFGELASVLDAEAHTTTINYDARGFKTALMDPNIGTWTYDYDVYGQLRTQTNALSQTTTLSYDEAGRLISRAEPEGTATFTYYTVGTGAIGKPNTKTAATGQSLFYQYSSTNGKPTLLRTTISGTAYDFNMSYDSFGRLDVLSYPNIAPARLRVNYDHDEWGNVVVVKDHTTPTTVYYSLQEVDAFNRDVNVLLGNGLTEYRDFDRATGHLNSIQTGPGLSATMQNLSFTWDETGNLESRTNALISKQETFVYDALNRLRSAQVTGLAPVTIDYSANGRITFKSDVGTYTYGSAAHPNAVTNVAGQTYSYDANGQMTSHGGDALTWYSFGQPEVLKAGSKFSKFFYDANHQRYSQNRTQGSTNTTIRYVGSLFETGALFESELTTGASTVFRHYVEVRGKRVAVVRRQSSTDTIQYLLRDHQDSVVEVTDSTGSLVQSLAYDAWGLRRDPASWAPLPTPFGGSEPVERGYTDHEHLDNVELINMNGRVQDPRLGLFISADPFVQEPYSSQSLNRYSYVRNNPLTFVDPSGFECQDTIANGYFCGDICLFFFSCEGIDFNDQLWMAETFGIEQQRPAFIFDPPMRFAEPVVVPEPTVVAENPPPVGAPPACDGCHSPPIDIDRPDIDLHEIAIWVMPGYDLGTCMSSRGNCGAVDWAGGIIGVIPGGKIVGTGAKATIKGVGHILSKGDDAAKAVEHTADQRALKELVDEVTLGGRKPLSAADAETVLDWADEVRYPGAGATAGDLATPSNWKANPVPHIHIPGAGRGGHVPVEPGVKPRTR
jgi:RHS repeat-associated protein